MQAHVERPPIAHARHDPSGAGPILDLGAEERREMFRAELHHEARKGRAQKLMPRLPSQRPFDDRRQVPKRIDRIRLPPLHAAGPAHRGKDQRPVARVAPPKGLRKPPRRGHVLDS